MKILGIVVIIVGVAMLFITGFNFVTEKNVVDAGVIQINQKENHPVAWSPIIGGILIVAGIVIVAINRNKK
ncbi:MAG: hypothetical protein SGJ10_14705 [Bacteroidota bacterium]|nr:hypothetical protein [Bacteroidota bacterium]